MNKELLETINSMIERIALIELHTGDTKSVLIDKHTLLDIQKELELQSINNSNLSETLECLENLIETIRTFGENQIGLDKFEERYKTIEQALLKAQEQEKVLSIIKEYRVDIWLLKQCDYENYIRIRKEAMVSIGQIVNEDGIILEDEIPQEEFELLKRYYNDR